MNPIVGITTYAANAQGVIPLPHQYVDCVRRAGGIPLLIPPGEQELAALVPRIDALVLAGGGDICPARYAGTEHDTIYMVDTARDESELRLVEILLQTRTPILAICRGLQVLNVALGGTLHPHVPDVVGERVLHRAPPREPAPHTVELASDSRLAATLQTTRTEIVSWHHQAVNRLGEGCRAVARAPDGIIEAIEVAAHPQVMAVQWHPELSTGTGHPQQRLFDQLVREATSR